MAMSWRIEFCHTARRHKNSTATSVAPTVVIRLLARSIDGSGAGISRYCHSQTKNTPTPYPAASANPDKTPWTAKCRGRSEGVSDAAKNKVANTRPTYENAAQRRAIHDRRRPSGGRPSRGPTRPLCAASFRLIKCRRLDLVQRLERLQFLLDELLAVAEAFDPRGQLDAAEVLVVGERRLLSKFLAAEAQH